MMEHVRQFDWCASIQERYFVEEADLDNCATEKIIKNRFHDPMVSSESEDDEQPNKIDWDEIFHNKLNIKPRLYIPAIRPVPPYAKKSTLTPHQHISILKILSAEKPKLCEGFGIAKPMRHDYKIFEEAKEAYQKEQKEYISWAKTLWTTDHCIRALRPKPEVETVYEAEFKMKAQRLRGLPRQYDVAGQITLAPNTGDCDMVLKEELVQVNSEDMPQVSIPDSIDTMLAIVRPCAVPEPCDKHPYQFVLPNEDTVSMLPITELHRELSIYAMLHGAKYVASENALKCLLQHDRRWSVPLSVCETLGPDGEKVNVIVLDSEFSVNKECAPVRTLKAFRHLLPFTLTPLSEKERIRQRRKESSNDNNNTEASDTSTQNNNTTDVDSSDDEDTGLVIDVGNDSAADTELPPSKKAKTEDSKCSSNSKVTGPSAGYLTRAATRRLSEEIVDIGLYNCTCRDSLYELPRRSFKRWQLKSKSYNDNVDIIVHCSHKTKGKSSEVILEAIPEYQIDLGVSQQTEDSIRSTALSLALRKNARVVYARVEGTLGEVASFDTLTSEQFARRHPQVKSYVVNTLHSTLTQLQGLLPGHYVLLHEQNHGSNALLLSSRSSSTQPKLILNFDSTQLTDTDEAKSVKTPPTITNELLPYHKHRRIAPCAFTPFENQVAKDNKKPGHKVKHPPQALKWPKKNKKKSKRRNNNNNN